MRNAKVSAWLAAANAPRNPVLDAAEYLLPSAPAGLAAARAPAQGHRSHPGAAPCCLVPAQYVHSGTGGEGCMGIQIPPGPFFGGEHIPFYPSLVFHVSFLPFSHLSGFQPVLPAQLQLLGVPSTRQRCNISPKDAVKPYAPL